MFRKGSLSKEATEKKCRNKVNWEEVKTTVSTSQYSKNGFYRKKPRDPVPKQLMVGYETKGINTYYIGGGLRLGMTIDEVVQRVEERHDYSVSAPVRISPAQGGLPTASPVATAVPSISGARVITENDITDFLRPYTGSAISPIEELRRRVREIQSDYGVTTKISRSRLIRLTKEYLLADETPTYNELITDLTKKIIPQGLLTPTPALGSPEPSSPPRGTATTTPLESIERGLGSLQELLSTPLSGTSSQP